MESALKKQFQYRLTHKSTMPCMGVMEQDEGEVNLPLCCDWPNRPKQKVCFEEGRDSLTRYQVVKREEKPQSYALSRSQDALISYVCTCNRSVIRLLVMIFTRHQKPLNLPIVCNCTPRSSVSTIHVVIGYALCLSLVTSIPKPRSRFCSISILSENYRTIKSYPKTNLIVGSG